MKQGNAPTSTLDLDDLERQLKTVAAPRRSGGDDPLAELARIVGHDDPLGRAGRRPAAQEALPPSFDDFLKVPPRPLAGAMPAHMPPVEPLFAERPAAAVDAAVELRDAESGDAKPDFSSAFEELGLRNALADEMQAVAAPTVDPVSAPSGHNELDELEARLAAAVSDDLVSMKSSELPPSVERQAIEVRSPVAVEAHQPTMPKGGFDDMLAEFDAAMRDVGAQKNAGQALPSLEPIVIPPPPPQHPVPDAAVYGETSSGLSADLGGAAAAGAAVVAAGAAKAASGRPKRGLVLAGGVIGVALIGIAGLLAFGGPKNSATGNAPVIAAKPGVTKERPANPGGVEVPNQDKEVLSSATGTRAEQPVRVAPREEQPVDLTQAQRTAETQSSGVRQIPGVLVIPPAGSSPAATNPAGASQPAVRPVASVPITLNGQPAAPAVAAPAPAPVASAPQAATPAAPAPQAAAPAEPRRVRTVPIRPDEGAPQRAQAQPRVVPANTRPAPAPEPDLANAPLRITPAANRSPQQTASAQSGLVPASTNLGSGNQPTTTQSAPSPQASSGSGFAIQLAAEGSEDAARARFNRMRSQHGDVLGGLNPNIRSAEVNGRSVYRVRVGNMSREEAVSVCEKLKANGASCFVARN